MKRFIRSLAKSLRADQGVSPARTLRQAAAFVTEGLEPRVLMAADLSGNMINKLGNPGAATSGPYAPGIVTAAGDGANGSSSTSDGDDTLSRAKKKTLDFDVSATISDGLDVDMYKFTVNRGKRITFDIDRPSQSSLDSVLRLFNSAGQEIAQSDDDAGPNEPDSLESFIDFTFTVTGTYYVAVSGSFNVGFNAVTGAGDVMSPSTGRYELIAHHYVNPDSDDTIATADDSIAETGTEKHVISTPTDVDLFKIKVKAGDTIAFDIDDDIAFPGDTLDSYLRIMNDNNVQLAANDDGDDPTEVASMTGNSYLEYTFLQGGTYFVGVSGKGNETYNIITGDGDNPGVTGHYVLNTTKLN